MRRIFTVLILGSLAAMLAALPAGAQADPVIHFIVAADSVRSAGGDQALAAWLPDQPDLAGAAVAQLLEIAVEFGDAGDSAAEAENVVLAEALSRTAPDPETAQALERLVADYRGWDEAARAARAAARASEEEAWAFRAEAPDSALVLLEAADEVYARIGDAHSRARVAGRVGATHWARQDADAVEQAYLEALRRRRAVRDRMLEGATLNGLGSLHYWMRSDLDAATDWYGHAIELRRAIGDRAGLGTSLTYAGNVEVGRGNLIAARELFLEARPLLDSNVAVVENLAGTAWLYLTMGRLADALREYEEAAELCGEDPDCPHTAYLLVEVGDLQRQTGQVREATASLERAEQVLEEFPDAETETRLWQVRAFVSMDVGDQDAAREQVVRALRLAQETGNAGVQSDVMTLLSTLYLDLGAPDRALTAATDALALAREVGDDALIRGAVFAQADVAQKTGEAEEAIRLYTEALEIDERLGEVKRIALDLTGRGGAYSLAGDLQRSRADLRRAASLLDEAGLSNLGWISLLNLADSFEDSAPDSAAYYYDQALSSLERGNDAIGGEALNTGYLFANRGRAYEEIARYYALRHREDAGGGWDARAFATAERSRARGLLELLDDSFVLDAGSEALALIDSLSQVDVATPEGRADRDRFRARFAELRAAYRGQAVERAPARLDELRENLDDGTLLLQYAVGDSTSLLWIVDRDASELVELPPRAELRRRVKAFRDAIAQPGTADAIVLREGRALYLALLGPAESRIGTSERLILVPDDVLFELPFEALLEQDSDASADWSAQPFFGRSHAPVLAPSATVYLELRQRSGTDFDRQLLAVGDVDYSGLDGALEPLPYTLEEVTRIGAGLAADARVVLTGPDATEPAFRRALDGAPARVVHLATHGLVDPAEPSRSCVALGASGGDDGYLYSLEILALRLQNPLVVLSACESALGRLERGEGVVGLTRSFLAAGARGVVASLWPVSDASTAELMTQFYDQLWQRRTAPEALRHARTALLDSEEWSHPYHWAAFVMLGTERMPW